MVMRRSRKKASEEEQTEPAVILPLLEPAAGAGQIGDLLVQEQFITSTQLNEALIQQSTSGKRLGSLLVELGALDERDLAKALARHFDLPFVDLGKMQAEPDSLGVIPESVARSLVALPMKVSDGELEVVVADPSDEVLGTLARAADRPIKLMIAPASDIRRAIDNSYRVLAAVDRHVEAFEAGEAIRRIEVSTREVEPESAPVVQVVNLLITQALRDRASDIHIEPQDGRVRVRYRIDGALHDVLALPVNIGPAIVSRIKIMAGMNIVERRRSQDGQLAMSIDSRQLDVRVATAATIWGEKAVLRLLDKSRPLYRLEDLGMSPATREVYSRLVRFPFGMVICAGPTGSGKTTTLYSTLKEVNQPDINIMTIEDPVEYIFPSINQIQINEQAGITFAGELKAILRQDPDVILVGEVRDVDTARIAVQSTLTGHFVMSSLHATDAAGALHRLLDMGIESFLIASSVIAVLGQRLVRQICTSCKTTYMPSMEETAFYVGLGGKPKTKVSRGQGCNFCSQTGYRERIGLFELLLMTDEMKEAIVQSPSQDSLRALSVKQGMHTLRDEAVRLVSKGVTTIPEIMRTLYIA